MKRRTNEEAELEQIVADHPLLRSRIPDRKLARIILNDATATNPERMERLMQAVAMERLTELIGCLQRGDELGAARILEPLSEDLAEKLLRAITRAIKAPK